MHGPNVINTVLSAHCNFLYNSMYFGLNESMNEHD